MPRAIRIHGTGGPEKMVFEEVAVGEPGPGEARIRHTAVGVNFIDVYQRSGLYQIPAPFVLGMEGAGVVEAVGPGVSAVAPGDRVAYTGAPPGSYAEVRLYPAERLVKLPSGIDDQVAASIMLKGLTAWYLVKRTHVVKPGDTVLVHAAAGGVGLILCQWASHLGATVIGTVGTPEKAELARAHGCHHPIVYTREDFAAKVMEITRNRGVPVVYDSVGKDTFQKSFEVLATRGHLVAFGFSSGVPDPVAVPMLGQKSASVTRPSLFHYIATRPELEEATSDLFGVVEAGAVRVGAPRTYALQDAAQAHRDLEARRTTGSIVLIP
ncbi:MAG TPA: quinone oxidoreductase [Azospirillaceae bacterium]|nr:quinone oxidoreductase [Azospirillaceae bacterium]